MKSKIVSKLFFISLILLLFIIALSMVEYKVYERQGYRNQAVSTVSRGWSADQQIVGPVIELRYSKTSIEKRFNKETEKYEEYEKLRQWREYRVLETMQIDSSLLMQNRHVGIFNVPVYTTNLDIKASNPGLTLKLDQNTRVTSTRLLFSISDMRGLANHPDLTLNGKSLSLQPGNDQRLLGNYVYSQLSLSDLSKPFNLRLKIGVRGVDTLTFTPTAKTLTANLSAPWPHPFFTGKYLPSNRTITENSFSAEWSINHFSSSIDKSLKACAGPENNCFSSLSENRFGVQLSNPVDVYNMTDRALKYGFLFVALTFIAFSLLELRRHHAIHFMQYGFVGASMAMFYLLLISLSEHISFGASYVIASTACSILIAAYLRVVFDNTKIAAGVGITLAVLYSMMFAILQSEDYAFLMGSLLLFTILAAMMFITRRLDWVTLLSPTSTSAETVS